MKKLLYSVSTALLLLSCNTEDPSLETEPGKGGNAITFVGRTFPETRTEIGVKDGNSYPVLWSSGDRIGIISPVETLFQNASATLNASAPPRCQDTAASCRVDTALAGLYNTHRPLPSD